ncbi:MAG TPA: IS66 family transposase [Buttiauxella sp.]
MLQESDAEKFARLERKIQELQAENERLRRALEEALRTAKRQAAPFSRRHPKAHPQKPGRKAGRKHGRACHRNKPTKVDQVIDVPLPKQCPHCAGGIQETGAVSQYQTEIPEPRVERIEFRIHLGRCRSCGRGVQGRDRRQRSAAVGSAGSQLGARAVALAILLNKSLGLPYGKTATVLQQGWGLEVSRGGLCQAIARAAQKAEPTYRRLQARIRGEPSVTADETGWKVAAQLHWMWVFSSPAITVYSIQPGRGFQQAAAILGEDFCGFLVRDGWAVYRQFLYAMHQTCLAHLLRRCREMIQVQAGRTAQFPRALQAILQSALHLRERRDHGQLSPHGLAVARGQLETGMDRLLRKPRRSPQNQRLANHLWRERDALFTFLYCPGLEATNWRAEQAIRPMVVTRKVWGGNRTAAGAYTQSILLSILATSRQQNRSPLPLLQQLLCSPHPKILNVHSR